MGDLLGSLTKLHTVVVRWLNWGQYRLEGNQGSPVEGVRPCPVGVVTGTYRRRTVAKWGQYRLEGDQGSPVEGFRPCPVGVVTGGIRACTQPEVCRRGRRAPRGVDCDDLSGRVRGTCSYLMSNLTSPGWLRKCLKGKRFSSIIT